MHKIKKRARLKDLAESIRIHKVAKHFKTTIGAVRSAVRRLIILREARWVFGQTMLRGPSKGGWMKHVFERR